MSEESSEKESGNRKLLAAGKLILLLGTPVAVLGGIFSAGVFVGVQNSGSIVGLESRLGIDPPEGYVDPAEAEGEEGEAKPDAEGDAEGDAKPDAKAETKPEAKPDAKAETKPETKAEPKPEAKPEPNTEPTPETKPEAQVDDQRPPLPVVTTAPFDASMGKPRTVRVKVLVDPAIRLTQEDWLAYVTWLMDGASRSYESIAGMKLELYGVGLWSEAEGGELSALAEDLRARNREGAELVIGLVARDRPEDLQLEGAEGLVFADLSDPHRYYTGLLRAVGVAFGAVVLTDASSPAWTRGSFMALGADAPDSGAPWLDADNRSTIVANKARTFEAPACPVGCAEIGSEDDAKLDPAAPPSDGEGDGEGSVPEAHGQDDGGEG